MFIHLNVVHFSNTPGSSVTSGIKRDSVSEMFFHYVHLSGLWWSGGELGWIYVRLSCQPPGIRDLCGNFLFHHDIPVVADLCLWVSSKQKLLGKRGEFIISLFVYSFSTFSFYFNYFSFYLLIPLS